MEIHPQTRHLFRVIRFPILFVLLLWLLWVLDVLFDLDLYKFGIMPRDVHGLGGILFSPLIHSTINHIGSNSIPLLILGIIMFYFYRKIAFAVFVCVYLTTGLCVWIFARTGAYHIGASGLVYGFVCFLFYSGIFRKNRRLLALSLLVTFLYGSLIFGVMPFGGKKISWESHLIGAISGGVTAFLLRRRGPQNDRYTWDDEVDDAVKKTEPAQPVVNMPSEGFPVFPTKSQLN